MQLHGIHHVTAVTGQAPANLHFYTKVLGLRLVKKTVNQDDVSAYHLFYADALGSPGTDMTFFDWPQTGPDRRGTDSIARTLFRVSSSDALIYWAERFDQLGVTHSPIAHLGSRSALLFEDGEGQRLALVDDGGVPFDGLPWDGADVPEAFRLRGFYGVALAVPQPALTEELLTSLLGFSRTDEYISEETSGEKVIVLGMDGGGPGREVHLIERPAGRAFLGAGGVHHVAFRLRDGAEQQQWAEQLAKVGVRHSGIVDRFYFQSLYFRISQGILFELATDGPGFATDEAPEHLGERLALPPFLEPRRQEIEANLKPL